MRVVLLAFFVLYRHVRGVFIANELLINEQIRDREVRVIGEDGNQLGVMEIGKALALAEAANLDLVNISPKATPPVCKIMDYGKYRFEQGKKQKEAKKNQKTVTLKEMRFSSNIDNSTRYGGQGKECV